MYYWWQDWNDQKLSTYNDMQMHVLDFLRSNAIKLCIEKAGEEVIACAIAEVFVRFECRPVLSALMSTFSNSFDALESIVTSRRPASRPWWRQSCCHTIDEEKLFNLKEEADGCVIVDLWHARRSREDPEMSFKQFDEHQPTFFATSYNEMVAMLEEV